MEQFVGNFLKVLKTEFILLSQTGWEICQFWSNCEMWDMIYLHLIKWIRPIELQFHTFRNNISKGAMMMKIVSGQFVTIKKSK